MCGRLEAILARTKQENECLIWQGCLNSDGYARMLWEGNANGKVHRIVYALSTGEDIDGKVVRHMCDNPVCINPDHLLVGTPADNMRDRDERERHGMSKITVAEVIDIRESSLTNNELAIIFNLHPTTIASIRNRRHWKWVQDNSTEKCGG